MSYAYADLCPSLSTEQGVETLTKVRANVARALREAGAVRAQEAWGDVTGDSWLMIAALDYMVEKGEICEVTDGSVYGQHRVFVGTR